MSENFFQNGEENNKSSFLKMFFQGIKPQKSHFSKSRVARQHFYQQQNELNVVVQECRNNIYDFIKKIPKEIPKDTSPSLTESVFSLFSASNPSTENIISTQFPQHKKEKKLTNAFDMHIPEAEKPSSPEKKEPHTSVFRNSRGKQPFYEAPRVHISHLEEIKPKKKKSPKKIYRARKRLKKQATLPSQPSVAKELFHVASVSIGLFILAFVGFNFSSLAVVSEKYWNATEYTQKQAALAHLTAEKKEPTVQTVQALPVAGIESQKSNIPYLNLSVTPPDTRIIIPKIGKNIPVIHVPETSLRAENWDQLEKDIQEGLRDGVVHYPGTAEPGHEGNAFFTGHSSYYPWDSGRYKSIFAPLHDLQVGDTYFVYHKGKKHEYIIRERKIVKPDDTSVLKQTKGKRISTLMTCTPIGTTINRLVLVAEEVI